MIRIEAVHGFTHIKSQVLPELEGDLHQYRHERTGARLIWLDRPDENKTFSVAFRTLPEDDTGVFHILEHSVLCGSKRYPVKRPFVEMMKSSLKTFLNAMTYPDKTVYPVSSRNEKDFLNLVHVYLDAVFHPLIYSRPEIFAQEGWHYEFQTDGKLLYKGVVFSEMKGAFASPDTLLQRELHRALFPDTSYRFVSGGDPVHIPELTYERFLQTHHRFYHPSNAYFFLDGQLDLNQILSILDREYLSDFDSIAEEHEFIWQRPVKSDLVRAYYEISPSDREKERALLAWGAVLGDFRSREEQMGVRILADTLCGGSKAPLKRCLISSGLAQDVGIGVADGILQPYGILRVRNFQGDRAEEVEDTIRKELERLVQEGLDRRQLRASLASLEFQIRERDYGGFPRGVAYGLTVLDSWLYGGEPAENLEVGGIFESLSRRVEEGWFEELLEKTFLNNPHSCRVLLLPSAALGDKKRSAEEKKLSNTIAAWSEAERHAQSGRQAQLEAWQSAEDTPEAAASLPRLTLADVSSSPSEVLTKEKKLGDCLLLFHPIPANGISYVNLYFDITDLPQEKISQASFLCNLLGELGTESHGNEELRIMQRLHLGSLSFSVEAYSGVNAPGACRIFLCVSFSALDCNIRAASEVVSEILLKTDFSDFTAIRELLRQISADQKSRLITSGSSLAMARVMAGCSAQGVVQECAGGFAFYQWLQAAEKKALSSHSELAEELKQLFQTIFIRNRVTVSVTGISDSILDVLEKQLFEPLPVCRQTTFPCALRPWGKKKEAILIPGEVSFAALGGSLLPYGGEYSGAMRVLSRVTSLGWLWDKIRIQGGAYGTGLTLGDNGCACFYSYRDPNASRSLRCYRQTAENLRIYLEGAPDLTNFILGTVAESEPLLLPRHLGKAADGLYWQGATYADRLKVRREILAADPISLAEKTACLEALAQDAAVCVVGPQEQISACGSEIDTMSVL